MEDCFAEGFSSEDITNGITHLARILKVEDGNLILGLSESSTLMIDLDPGSKTGDYLDVTGDIRLDGILMLTNLSINSYKDGDVFQIFLTSGSLSGHFDKIYPIQPGKGLSWDTTFMSSNGYLRVVQTTGVSQGFSNSLTEVYPNPFSEGVFLNLPFAVESKNIRLFDMEGRNIAIKIPEGKSRFWKIPGENLNPGVYIFRIESPGVNPIFRKIIKQQ